MTYWILSIDGRTYGPADEQTLRRWIAEGRLTPATPVGPTEQGPWTEARMVLEVSDLFVTAAPRTGAAGPAAGANAGAPPVGPSFAATQVPPGWPPNELAVPLLVSGIVHLLYGASAVGSSCLFGLMTFGWGCCLGIAGIPAIVLGAFELSHYSQRSTMDPNRWLDRSKLFAILDICCMLWGNVVAVVCGILVLTQLDGARMRINERGR